MLPLLTSLTGLLFGYILTYIAPEEINLSRKYFLLMKRIIFVIIGITITYFLAVKSLWWIFLILIFVGILLMELKIKHRQKEIIIYLSFIIPYFFINEKLLLASLIFLYGFPLGSMLRKI